MKKVFKIFVITEGFHGNRVYYDTTPKQLADVTYDIAEKHGYVSEKAALQDILKLDQPRLNGQEFLILPVYTKK